jgi:hypothetical protein
MDGSEDVTLGRGPETELRSRARTRTRTRTATHAWRVLWTGIEGLIL